MNVFFWLSTGKQASMRVNITWQKLFFIVVIAAAAMLVMFRNIERKSPGERLLKCTKHQKIFSLK